MVIQKFIFQFEIETHLVCQIVHASLQGKEKEKLLGVVMQNFESSIVRNSKRGKFRCHLAASYCRDGLQHRRNSWQDGVLGTNCPIPPGWNWTYQFQVKDQIGSFFYFPSLGLQRTAGGFGPVTVNNRNTIPAPFAQPDGDFTIFIGDWYTQNHTVSSAFRVWYLSLFVWYQIIQETVHIFLQDLRKLLDEGKELGIPDGVLINGKGPYNPTLAPKTFDHETINVESGEKLHYCYLHFCTILCLIVLKSCQYTYCTICLKSKG